MRSKVGNRFNMCYKMEVQRQLCLEAAVINRWRRFIWSTLDFYTSFRCGQLHNKKRDMPKYELTLTRIYFCIHSFAMLPFYVGCNLNLLLTYSWTSPILFANFYNIFHLLHLKWYILCWKNYLIYYVQKIYLTSYVWKFISYIMLRKLNKFVSDWTSESH